MHELSEMTEQDSIDTQHTKSLKRRLKSNEKNVTEGVLSIGKLFYSSPVHLEHTHSPLSKESSNQNYRGFLHLTILVLVVNMLRLIMENIRKYGLLLSIPGNGVPLSDLFYGLISLSTLWPNMMVSFFIEKTIIHSDSFSKSKLCRYLIILNVSSLILVPSYVVWTRVFHPLLGSLALSCALILCMKLISYHIVNGELRMLKQESGEGDFEKVNPYPLAPYPVNVTLKNICYFWIAPTLCYQPTYPRNSSISVKFFMKRIIEFTAALAMMHILIDQFAMPTVQNSMKHIDNQDFLGMVERLLKLSISSLYIWLLMFYALFHSFLNAFAELLCFGDRRFYDTWWNANTIEEYWRLWNLPVHNWLKRHVYHPLRSLGFTSSQAQTIIFLLSAAAHEYLVAVPTKIVQGWAFFAMILQLPLIQLTSYYLARHPRSSVGNFIFWITFCILGQPMCILLYYRAWINKSSSPKFFFF